MPKDDASVSLVTWIVFCSSSTVTPVTVVESVSCVVQRASVLSEGDLIHA
jgi:hypothetical protein